MGSRGCFSVLQQSLASIFRRSQDTEASFGESAPLLSQDAQTSMQTSSPPPDQFPRVTDENETQRDDPPRFVIHPSTTSHHGLANGDTIPPPSPGSLITSRHNRLGSDASSVRSRSNSRESSIGEHCLKRQLQEEERQCHQSSTKFIIPKGRLEARITADVVAQDIRTGRPEIDDEKAQEYAQVVCRYARRLYATLVYVKRSTDICDLLEEGLNDEDLPLKPEGGLDLLLLRRDGRRVRALENWTLKNRKKFNRIQPSIAAPVFELLQHYEFDNERILPFMQLKQGEVSTPSEGGYSKVYPVRIHPDHHNFWDSPNTEEEEPLVAVKELFSSAETEFKKEETILRQLSSKKHPHLIKLLATYKRKSKYHLMFRWADANLRSYWENRPLPEFDHDTVLWSLRQMKGIANALMVIHVFRVTIPLSRPNPNELKTPKDVSLNVIKEEEMYGRHGDIKPENVLWFKNPGEPQGVLQIADFGLGRFHGRDSRSRIDPETVAASPTYEPPECKLGLPVSRKYDLWSLGCLYLEFVTWLLKGSDEIVRFSHFRGGEPQISGIDDDNFYTIYIDGDGVRQAMVREKVCQWVDDLHSHERCSQLIHDILDMTMRGLLVVDSQARDPSNFLNREFAMCWNRATKDKAYMLKPVPRQPRQTRANSTSVLSNSKRPKPNARNTSVAFADANSPGKPKDLLLRKLGTPSDPGHKKPTQPKHAGTWPLLHPEPDLELESDSKD